MQRLVLEDSRSRLELRDTSSAVAGERCLLIADEQQYPTGVQSATFQFTVEEAQKAHAWLGEWLRGALGPVELVETPPQWDDEGAVQCNDAR